MIYFTGSTSNLVDDDLPEEDSDIQLALAESYMWAKKEKVDSRVLDEWQCKILETVQARIDKLKTKNKNPRNASANNLVVSLWAWLPACGYYGLSLT